MKIKFLPLDYDTLKLEEETYIRIFGKTENKSCCIIDKPIFYFYILPEKPKQIEKILKLSEKIKQVKKAEIVGKNYQDKKQKAVRIYCEYINTKEISEKIKEEYEVKTRERDINIITKYIINKKIKPLVWYEIEGDNISENEFNGISNSVETDFVLSLNKIKELKKQEKPKLNVLAFDIETEEFEIGKGKILMISLVTENLKKVLTWKKCKKKNFVECYKSEKEMLEAFQEYVNQINPDVITGYFSDGFDFPYLRARARKNNLELRLGNAREKIKFTRGRVNKAKISGLVHIDLFKFIETVYSQYLQSETLSLDEVSSELLNEKKIEINHLDKKTEDISEKEWETFFKYNLKDSILTYKLFNKIFPDILEFTKIVQEPLYKTSRFSISKLLENYIIHNLEKFNEISEKRPSHNEIQKRRARQRNIGAFVLQPTPGLYENIAIFDFTSMHTSIIITFNISGATLSNKKQKNSYKTPEFELDGKKQRFYFSKKTGFIPSIMKEIMELRKKYKKEYKENSSPINKARSNAFKVLSAAIHGYLAFFGARYYSLEAAGSTLAFVREFNKETIKKVGKKGYKVIFSDTDSVGFYLGNKTKSQVKEFLKKLNSELPGIMHLELEGFYKRGLWITKRTGEFGAKKKYALIDEKNNLKIRGFETVRRDWCKLARQVQNKVLELILKQGNEKKALKYVREIIKKLKKRNIDKKQLLIRTQLKKPLSKYKSEGPHVAVARKMLEQGIPIDAGMLISYYIAETKKKRALVRERAKLPEEKEEYDINYYINNQIIPAVENILQVFNIKKQDIEKKSQRKIFDY